MYFYNRREKPPIVEEIAHKISNEIIVREQFKWALALHFKAKLKPTIG